MADSIIEVETLIDARQPILIVEDNDEDFETILWSIKKFLSYPRIFRCKDGEEALEFLNRCDQQDQPRISPRPALVLLDLNLPGQDGRSILEYIKQNPQLKSLPVVVFTGSLEPEDMQQSYDQGANSFIRKPLNLDSFKKAVQLTLAYWLGPVENLSKSPVNLETKATLEQWPVLQELSARFSPYFLRPETRTQALTYLISLLTTVERKNCTQLASQAGDTNAARMQRLLHRTRWNVPGVRDETRYYILEKLAHRESIIILEEISFLKKGKHSVGVLRQYSSDAGEVKNCQLGIFLIYASLKGVTLLDRELYLPLEWIKDPPRRAAAEVPEELTYFTKTELAAQMLSRMGDRSFEVKWITGSSVFGDDSWFQAWLEEHNLAYILEITGDSRLRSERSETRELLSACELVGKPRPGIKRSKRPPNKEGKNQAGEWSRLDLGESSRATGYRRWLVFQTSAASPIEAYWVIFGPASTPLSEIIGVIEKSRVAKAICKTEREKVGLAQYEVRSWPGWYRHVTLAMVAQASQAIEN
jgi:SRSO17 transposase/CheY-like chemotaxis protein